MQLLRAQAPLVLWLPPSSEGSVLILPSGGGRERIESCIRGSCGPGIEVEARTELHGYTYWEM